jgi:Spy/CpxP family protein refolding chaperone
VKRFWFLLLAVSLGVNAGLAVIWLARPGAFPPAPGRPPEPIGPPRIERMLDQHLARITEGLQLSKKQHDELEVAYRTLFPRIIEQNRKVSDLRREVHDGYNADRVDPDAFRARVRALSSEQARLDSFVTEAMLSEASVLTTEQRRRYAPGMPWIRTGQPAPARRAGGPGPRMGPGPGGMRGPGPGGPPMGPPGAGPGGPGGPPEGPPPGR